jgi:Lrp/AsnC family transcriptional regulator
MSGQNAHFSIDHKRNNVVFDNIDRRILTLLQNEGDLPVADIAARVGLSASPCWRRIRRMEEAGLISKRVVLVNRRLANVPMTVFVSVRAPRHSIDWLNLFREAISDVPEIVEAYRLAGDTDYLLRLVVPSVEIYDKVYKQLIARLEFSDVSACISMEEMKFTTAICLDYCNWAV